MHKEQRLIRSRIVKTIREMFVVPCNVTTDWG